MEIKCTCCGSKDFVEVGVVGRGEYDSRSYGTMISNSYSLFSFGSWICGDAQGSAELDSCMIAKICKNCGHVEFFAKELADRIIEKQASEEEKKKIKEEEIKKSEDELVKLLNENKKLEKEIYDYIEKIKDENITIKQQKEYKLHISWLVNKLKSVDNNIIKYKKVFYAFRCKYNDQIQEIIDKQNDHDGLYRKYRI